MSRYRFPAACNDAFKRLPPLKCIKLWNQHLHTRNVAHLLPIHWKRVLTSDSFCRFLLHVLPVFPAPSILFWTVYSVNYGSAQVTDGTGGAVDILHKRTKNAIRKRKKRFQRLFRGAFSNFIKNRSALRVVQEAIWIKYPFSFCCTSCVTKTA